MTIYVEQFEAWWSLSISQGRQLLDAIRDGRGWNLDIIGRRLRRRPKYSRRINGEYWWIADPYRHPHWVAPCDWDTDSCEYREAEDAVEEGLATATTEQKRPKQSRKYRPDPLTSCISDANVWVSSTGLGKSGDDP